MPDLSKSVRREVSADKVRAFSSWNDLLSHVVEKGEVTSYQDLLERRPDLLDELLFHWYRQGQIACVFAMRLSRQPSQAGWYSIRVSGDWTTEQVAARIDEVAAQAQAIQLIFPGLTTANDVARLVVKLCADSRWSCCEIPWKTFVVSDQVIEEHGRSIPVGLRWHPSSGGYTSWALGIAPFDPMPFTRRFVGAPFSVIVLRPSAPTDFIPPKDDPITHLPAAHLAHMDDGFGKDEELRDKVRNLTSENKRDLLGSDLWSTARAQVTFTFPLWCREILGEKLQQLPPDASAGS